MHRPGRDREDDLVGRLHDHIGLEAAAGALAHRGAPLRRPVAQQPLLVGGGGGHRDVLRDELLVGLLVVRRLTALLEGHPGRAERRRRNRVAETHEEEVVGRVVRVVDAALLERPAHRRAEDLVDEVNRLRGDLVVDRVGVGREEVGRADLLVGVDEQHWRVAPHERHLAVGLGLRASEPVAVHVEPVGVGARGRRAPVRVLQRHHQRHEVAQPHEVRAVGAGRQLVEQAHRRIAARRLVAVHVARHPCECRPASGDRRCLALGAARQPQRAHVARDSGETARREGRGFGHECVHQRRSAPGARGRRQRHAIGCRVDGRHVAVDLVDGRLPRSEREAGHRLPRRHPLVERRCRLAVLRARGAWRGERGRDDRGRKGKSRVHRTRRRRVSLPVRSSGLEPVMTKV